MERATGFEPATLGLGSRIEVRSLSFALFRRCLESAPMVGVVILGGFAVVRRGTLSFVR